MTPPAHPPVRVFVVDDSAVVRKVVTGVLAAEPGVEVVGEASNGRLALERIPEARPDLVTLDVEMPEMDGLATLRELRRIVPGVRVIMFSTLTERGASTTLDALLLGANDYVTKPAGVRNVDEAREQIRRQMVPKVHALCPRGRSTVVPAFEPATAAPFTSAEPTMPAAPAPRPVAARPTVPPAPVARRDRAGAPSTSRRTAGAPATAKAPAAAGNVRRPDGARAPRAGRIDVVCIGVSTGGPNALATVLPVLPSGFPVPVLIVQHMPPVFTRQLATRLTQQCRVPVHEAQDGDVLTPGAVWLAQGGHHLVVRRNGNGPVLETNDDPPENSCRPAADVLFRSVADTFGANVLCVVMTGMGQDGLRGAEVIAAAGGRVLAQDEESSVVWGMPGAVARAGLAERVLPLTSIGQSIVDLVAAGRVPVAANAGRHA